MDLVIDVRGLLKMFRAVPFTYQTVLFRHLCSLSEIFCSCLSIFLQFLMFFPHYSLVSTLYCCSYHVLPYFSFSMCHLPIPATLHFVFVHLLLGALTHLSTSASAPRCLLSLTSFFLIYDRALIQAPALPRWMLLILVALQICPPDPLTPSYLEQH